ncbi:inositol monophosphatase family protein [Enterovibrio calviensis]|uniref:inositol monophosphatase family protein n=1 Tax=Enterovibrio calviensis TaxID=91359 RepID=UPI000A7388F7|nr:inositol monophosphatase family protein [Enterovibrio calviensis]
MMTAQRQEKAEQSREHVEQLMGVPLGTVWTILRELISQASKDIMLPKFGLHQYQHDVSVKADKSLVTLADKQMQHHVMEALSRYFPLIPILGEEHSESEQHSVISQLDNAAWVLDPIDGTGNFAAGIPYFCTSLALVVKGEVVLGIVHDPCRDETFFAFKGYGAHLNGEPLAAQKNPEDLLSDTMALVDFKRLPSDLVATLVTDPPYRSQRSFGASALDWCWIATSRCQIYLHGSQMLWDYAAGKLILEEAGGESSTFEESEPQTLSLMPRSVVAACDPQRYKAWKDWLQSHQNA